jgi:hypothetical protein
VLRPAAEIHGEDLERSVEKRDRLLEPPPRLRLAGDEQQGRIRVPARDHVIHHDFTEIDCVFLVGVLHEHLALRRLCLRRVDQGGGSETSTVWRKSRRPLADVSDVDMVGSIARQDAVAR